MTIVDVNEARVHLDLLGTQNDHFVDEIAALVEAADDKIDDLAGPVVPRTLTETVRLSRGYGLLSTVPVLEVVSVTGATGSVLTGWVPDDAGGIGGLTTAPLGRLVDGSWGVPVTVQYRVGRDPIPAKFRRAALRYIAWSWRRDHGGSDTYNPDGEGAAVMGVAGIDKELRFILGRDVRVGDVL